MPSVIGKTLAEAREAILQNAPNASISEEQQYDSGESGVVLMQTPDAGEAITGVVELVISTGSVPVPDVKGLPVGTARKQLEKSGFEVEENAVSDPVSTDGTVVGQRPAPGATNEAKVTLDVARKEAAQYLFDLGTVEYDDLSVKADVASTDGIEYTKAVTLTRSWPNQGFVSYQLDRRYQQFDTVLGVSDQASSDTRIAVEMQAEDGRILFSATDIVLGAPIVVEKLNVDNVLRLKILVTFAGSSPALVLGDPRLSNPR